VAEISQKFALLLPTMDERQKRLWFAAEATAIGRGGLAAVTAATGVLRKRIGMGIRELKEMARAPPIEPPGSQRIRSPGAGRKKIIDTDATLSRSSLQKPGAIRSCCFGERRRAFENWPGSYARWATASVARRSASYCMSSATACSRCPKPAKARRIRTETRSSDTSIARPAIFKREASP